MSLLSPQLRQSLGRSRVVAGSAVARGGVGERKSRTKGEGIEFEDFRPYAFGDDLRRLDPHVHARLGQNVIRQYNVPERLSVAILVDTSESMIVGGPEKSRVALGIAAGLALCSLKGSDTVCCGALVGGSVDWYPRLSGAGRMDELEAWLAHRRFGGRVDLLAALSSAVATLPRHGLLIIVSDMWFDDVAAAMDLLADADQSVIVVRVLAPQEADPRLYAAGPVRVVDAETGEEIEIELGDASVEAYKRLFSASAEELRERVIGIGGRLAGVTSDADLSDVFQRTFRQVGIIR